MPNILEEGGVHMVGRVAQALVEKMAQALHGLGSGTLVLRVVECFLKKFNVRPNRDPADVADLPPLRVDSERPVFHIALFQDRVFFGM